MRAQGTEVAHDHADEVEPLLALETEIVLLLVVDTQAFFRRSLASVGDRVGRKVDAGNPGAESGKAAGVEPGSAAEIGDVLIATEFETVVHPVHRFVDDVRCT